MAMKLTIEAILKADFCTNWYVGRPKKSAPDAVDDIALGYGRATRKS